MKFIQAITPQAKRISDVSSEEIYQLPLSCMPSFEKLFTALDESLDSLKVESYGISITTLEEVFLSVNSKKKDLKSQMSNADEPVSAKGIDVSEIEYDFKDSYMTPMTRFVNLFRVLIWKRLIYFKRDIKGLFMELVLPIMLTLMGVALLTVTFITIEPALEMSMSFYSPQNIIYGSLESLKNANVASIMDKTYHESLSVYTASASDAAGTTAE